MVVLAPLDRRSSKEAQSLQRALVRSKTEAVVAARRMLFLVKAVDLTVEPLYAGPALDRALWRYEALWLPLLLATAAGPPGSTAAAAPLRVLHSSRFAQTVEEIRAKNYAKGGLHLARGELVPPIDIAWVWHCHRLNPLQYARDVASLTAAAAPIDTTFDDAFVFSDGEDAQSKRLRSLWDIVFPNEPFMPRYLLSHTYQDEERDRRRSIASYNSEKMRAGFRCNIHTDSIKRIAGLQRVFLWQVVGEPGDRTDRETLIETNEYLSRAFDRYTLFLALHKHTAPGDLLVPMNDINIMWHAHVSCSYEYKTDCQALLGYVLRHDTVAVEDRRVRRMTSGQGKRVVAFRDANDQNGAVSGAALGNPAVGDGDAGAPQPSGGLGTTAPGNATPKPLDPPTTTVVMTTPTTATTTIDETGKTQVATPQRAGSDGLSAAGSHGQAQTGASDFSDPSMAIDHAVPDDDTDSLGLASVELAELDEEEREELLEKRRRVVSIRETRALWESTYGSNPRYDLPDTLYRGEPAGERGGFYEIFVRENGSSMDLSWPVAFVLMFASCMISLFGIFLTGWFFVEAMINHGKFLLGLPVGMFVVASGVYFFLAVPVNRPLSSDARFWLDRSLKQTHNPLPPFLISSTKFD
jgi:Glycine-rich domain-containing protein-like